MAATPSARLLTLLFVAAVSGDSTSERQYFDCIVRAKHADVRRHQRDVERFLRSRERKG